MKNFCVNDITAKWYPQWTHSLLIGVVCFISATVSVAQGVKTIRLSFPIAETSFDSAFASDEGSQSITERVFEPLLEYDYLARPVKLAPRTIEAMPVVSDNGATFLFKLQKGIYFADDPAFGGKKRELTASDYAYSLKRLLDPKVKSPWQFLVEGKLIGGDEARAAAVKSGAFDYDAPMPGLEAVDRHTLRIRLKATDYNFLYILAMPSTSAVAREVVERYGGEIGTHPVGTGPYQLAREEYKRASKTVLVKNPNYRKRVWEWQSNAPEDQRLIKAMAGKTIPIVQRVEIYVVEEGQAAWLAFLQGQHDYMPDLPPAVTALAQSSGVLKPEFAAKKLRLTPKQTPNLFYNLFNMEHPIYGGYSNDRIALRRAIQYAFPLDEMIRVIYAGNPIAAKGVIPPNVVGYSANRARSHHYDPELGKALLDKFGYKDRDGDGYREMPDGAPLVIDRISGTSLLARQMDELWKRALDGVGLKVSFEQMKVPDRRKAAREGKAKMMVEAWNADYPDAENFFQLLYGGNANAGGENYARFKLKAFDERYEKMVKLPPGRARDRLITELEDLVKYYAPWITPWHDVSYYIEQSWLIGFKKHPIGHDAWEYADIDETQRKP
jgi:oligopeptide transport system substrate-binding protein